ncbi:hypothetical protein [Paraflavitalea speifideaquila]|uniref:hypothetical protein n=1 Tax=Paraflavitalea speifideaquila TaxID=3076558 RepID=UPI0028E3AB72|nr:hypothetical protein [Paraflavitalea speifideiaquila]
MENPQWQVMIYAGQSGHENKKFGRDSPKIVDYYFEKSMHIGGGKVNPVVSIMVCLPNPLTTIIPFYCVEFCLLYLCLRMRRHIPGSGRYGLLMRFKCRWLDDEPGGRKMIGINC